MQTRSKLTVFGLLMVMFNASLGAEDSNGTGIQRKTCEAPDGVTIVYSVSGTGKTALVFVHGGLANRTFFDRQLVAFAGQHRVVALDLAGHGESGANRMEWGLPQFGGDVKAVVEAVQLERVILFGNSLGGPTAIEAALLMPDRVVGVVGIDTFQRIDFSVTMEDARRRAEAFRQEYSGTVKSMVKTLFHPDGDAAILAEAEKRMQKTSPAVAHDLFLSLGGYDLAAAAGKLAGPLRAINGDLFPTDVDGVREIKADFKVVVMEHTGHYPMLERPDQFNRHVRTVVEELSRKSGLQSNTE